jgi:TusE/DsrC/DsvC family sulfur relay protein
MYEINKFIANQGLDSSDPEGHFAELTRWSPRTANRLAEEEGLVLDDPHWEVIYCLRERYRKLGPDWTARQMTKELERDFAGAGGRRFLYTLFPRGPLAQGCKLAGLPLPHGTVNRSFGSVH